jgi:hypothetical protein
MQSGDLHYDALQAALQSAKASGDPKLIASAQEACNLYRDTQLTAAQSVYLANFHKGLCRN